jgi:hypothetical protein
LGHPPNDANYDCRRYSARNRAYVASGLREAPNRIPYVHQRQASGMFRPCSRLRTFHDSSVKSLYDTLNIEHTRGKSKILGVGGCERQSVPGIENVFVLFREQSIGCNRMGCLRLTGQSNRGPRFPTGSPGAAFELVRSLQDASGIANSQTKDQASRCNIDQRYEREAGCK